MPGITATPGHMPWVTFSTLRRKSGSGVVFGDETTGSGWVTLIDGSASARTRVSRVPTGASPGMMRHCTVAWARCGRAFSWCPADSMVATQVERSRALSAVSSARRAAAAWSGGLAATASMSALLWPPLSRAMRLK